MMFTTVYESSNGYRKIVSVLVRKLNNKNYQYSFFFVLILSLPNNSDNIMIMSRIDAAAQANCVP